MSIPPTSSGSAGPSFASRTGSSGFGSSNHNIVSLPPTFTSSTSATSSTSLPAPASIPAPAPASASASASAASSSSTSSAPHPPTPLQPLISASGFTFPPIYSFPPFFTLQPNLATRAHQIKLWTELVLRWGRYTRTWEVGEGREGEVWANERIKRRLQPEGIKQLLAHMAKEGLASPEPLKQTTTYLLYWRKPEEWGQLIYDWVADNGLIGSIMTLYEITDGDLSHTTEFRQLHPALLRRALDTLVKKGKAQLLKGEGEVGDGVRFL